MSEEGDGSRSYPGRLRLVGSGTGVAYVKRPDGDDD
jgi:hypothetical protein